MVAESKLPVLVSIEQKRDLILQQTPDVEVKTPEDYEKSSAAENTLKALIKESEKARDSEVRPYNEEVKSINSAFKVLMEPVVARLNSILGKNSAYQRDELRKQREEQERLNAIAQRKFDKQVKAGKTPLVPEPLAPIVSFTKSVKTDAGTTTTKVFWNFMYASEADSKSETTRIDRRFLSIEEGKLKAFIKQGIWTKDVEVKPGYWTIKECGGILVFEDVTNVSRRA